MKLMRPLSAEESSQAWTPSMGAYTRSIALKDYRAIGTSANCIES